MNESKTHAKYDQSEHPEWLEGQSTRPISMRSDRPLPITSLFAALDLCESLQEVEDVLKIAIAQGHTIDAIREMRAEQNQRLGRIVVREILAGVGVV